MQQPTITWQNIMDLCSSFDGSAQEIGYHLGHSVIQDYNISVGDVQWILNNQFTPEGKISPNWYESIKGGIEERGITDVTVARAFGFLNMLMSLCAHRDDDFEGEFDDGWNAPREIVALPVGM